MTKKQFNWPAKISADDLCRLTGLTDRRHRQLSKDGFFPPPIKSQYQFEPTILGLFRYLVVQRDKRFGELALREKQLTVDRLQFDFDVVQKKYVPLIEVTQGLRQFAMRIRNQFLQLPQRTAAKLAMMTDPVDVEIELTATVREILTLLAKGPWGDVRCPKCDALLPTYEPNKQTKKTTPKVHPG